MSGGQKQRISLARAVYADSDIYLVDDALSALDAFVGKKIFDNVFAGKLKNKTVVIVTHAIQYLPYCDNCYLMENGSIVAQGAFYNIKKTNQYHEYVYEVKDTLEKQSKVSMAKSIAITGLSAQPNLVQHQELIDQFGAYESSEGGDLISEAEDFDDINVQIRKNNMRRASDVGDMDDVSPKHAFENPSPANRNLMSSQQLRESNFNRVSGNVKHLQSKVLADDDLMEPDFGDKAGKKKRKGQKQILLEKQEAEILRLQQVILDCEKRAAEREIELQNEEEKRKILLMEELEHIPMRHPDHAEAVNFDDEKNPEQELLKGPSFARKEKGSLVKAETRFTGQIPFSIWKWWFGSGGTCLNILNFTLHILIVVTMLAQDWWVGIWAVGTYKLTQGEYTWIYFIIFLFPIISTGIRFRVWGNQVANASLKIYNGLIYNLLRRPMSFFDTTQVGQILNRCGKDADDMDFVFPMTLNGFMSIAFKLTGVIIMSCVIMPLTLIIVVILLVVIYLLAVGFIKTSTELRRLNQLSTSPIISTLAETINGLTSIRVFDKIDFFSVAYMDRIKVNNRVFLHEGYVQTWMTIWLDISMATLIGSVSFFVVLTRYVNLTSDDSANVYGFVLSSTISMGGYLPMMLFTLTECMKSVSSVQRLHEYFTNKEIERPYEEPAAPKEWPVNGEIEIENLTVRYREGLPLVLDGISLKVGRFEKVGVVGRTGSGKSTMILALTRIIEMDGDKQDAPVGHVSIDGVRIDKIGLHELRKFTTIIPQDPLMLAGTLRFNVDPIERYQDDEIVRA